MITQAAKGVLALALGVLTITGSVRLWHFYVFAFLFGSVAALDSPVRQTLVAELVGDDYLHNAIALNSTSFNAGCMIGPAVAGIVIAKVGTGWPFAINGLSFFAVLVSMSLFRLSELYPNTRARGVAGGFVEGFRYAWRRPDLRAILIMLFLLGTFGLNFPVFTSTKAVKVFHTDARGFGLLSSIMAIGTIAGALLSAGLKKPTFASLFLSTAVFGIGCTFASLAPGYWWYAAALVVIGVAALMLTNATKSMMQLSTEPSVRGRVMALRLAVMLGGTPIGAPIVGWVANRFGPRWALGVGASSGLAAASVAMYVLLRTGGSGRSADRELAQSPLFPFGSQERESL
jgi:predicted MFS family arabinose efflux permease